MSKQYDNEKRFALFKNDKANNPKRPDYRGTIQINGQEYKMSGWLKESAKGEFISGQIEVAQPKPDAQPQSDPTPAPKPAARDDEEVPF